MEISRKVYTQGILKLQDCIKRFAQAAMSKLLQFNGNLWPEI